MNPLRTVSSQRQASGFTLIEAIMVIVITGILASVVAVFITKPVQGYVDSVRRAELSDAADVALRRLVREVRSAVPNSVRINCASVSGWCFLEFVPTKGGGRYRNATDSISTCGVGVAPFCLCTGGTPNAKFDVLGIPSGSPPPAVQNDFIVVYNDASLSSGPACAPAPTDLYCATGSRSQVLSVANATASASATITTTPALANTDICSYTNNRFQVVDKDVQAVTYACPTATVGTLTRYWKYGFNPSQSTTLPPGGTSAAVLLNATCIIDKSNVGTGSIIFFKLTVTDSASGEKVEAFREITLDNDN